MRFMKRSTKFLAYPLAVAGLVLGGSSMAVASSTSAGLVTASQTLRATVVDPSCVAALRTAHNAGRAGISVRSCAATVVSKASKATVLTARDLARAKSTMSSADYASLAAAAATATVYHKAYSQTISQITDQEQQYGTFYYNGTRAWVTVSYSGHVGTHYCVVNYAIGYTISKDYCSDTGSTSKRTLSMVWNVALGLIPRIPTSWTETYRMYVSASGAITQ